MDLGVLSLHSNLPQDNQTVIQFKKNVGSLYGCDVVLPVSLERGPVPFPGEEASDVPASLCQPHGPP